jgi:hypothetical protein
MSALAEAPGSMNAAGIAVNFRQGKRVEPAISAILAAIARMGFITRAAEG